MMKMKRTRDSSLASSFLYLFAIIGDYRSDFILCREFTDTPYNPNIYILCKKRETRIRITTNNLSIHSCYSRVVLSAFMPKQTIFRVTSIYCKNEDTLKMRIITSKKFVGKAQQQKRLVEVNCVEEIFRIGK